MNLAIEFHDSELTSIAKRSGLLELRLDAYIHKSKGTPGVDAGTGWWQDAMLFVADGVVEGEITHWPAELYDGTLEIDGETIENVVPIPLDRCGTIRLTLKPCFYDDPIVVRGSRVRLELFQGVPRRVENFPGL